MDNQDFAAKLLQADGLEENIAGTDPWLARILVQEEAFERRVRRLAVGSWCVVIGSLPLMGGLVYWIREGAGTSVEIARAYMAVLIPIAIIGLFIAIVFTFFWLFRARTPTLRVIERRLALLEKIIVDGKASG